MPDRCASVSLGALGHARWSKSMISGGVDGGLGDVERMPTFMEMEDGDWPSQKDQNT